MGITRLYMGITRFHTSFTRLHRNITRLHRGITIIHISAARWRRRGIMDPVHAALVKGLGDNNHFEYCLIRRACYRLYKEVGTSAFRLTIPTDIGLEKND